MYFTTVGAGAVGAGAASRYGSGSDQKMRLLAAPAPQHWYNELVRYSSKIFYGRYDALKTTFYCIKA
jgi:hypothetical protein